MKSFGTFLLVSSALLFTGSASAFDGFFVTEKLKEKIVCDPTCTENQRGKFQGFATFGLSDSFILSLDEQSSLTVQIGDFNFSAPLGDDPNYQAGDTSVQLRNVVLISNGSLVVLTVKASWSDGNFRLRIKGITPYTASPVAASLIGTSTGIKNVDVPMAVTLNFAGISSVSAPWSGVLTRKTVNVNSVDYELDKISLAGVLTF
ncbi:MAG: hypothetical protein ACR2IE_18990 [Candidatus Sumerlaeaceae bacterium]